MNEIFNKKLADTELGLGEDTEPRCYFCEKVGKEQRSFPIAEDSQDAEAGGIQGKHWLCWIHVAEFENREGVFDPFAFLE